MNPGHGGFLKAPFPERVPSPPKNKVYRCHGDVMFSKGAVFWLVFDVNKGSSTSHSMREVNV